MTRIPARAWGFLVISACLASPVSAAPGKTTQQAPTEAEQSAQSPPAPLPNFKKVQEALKANIEKQPGYRPGDLITREQVTNALKEIDELGWQLNTKDQEQLLGKLLPEQHFLVRQFHTPAGTRFMRRIATYPEGYDRVQRLSYLQGGENRVRELINTADGYKMVQYMTTTNGGKNLGVMLGDAPHGRDFNKPTGTIYTQGQLEKVLKAAYDQEVQRREQAAKQPAKR